MGRMASMVTRRRMWYNTAKRFERMVLYHGSNVEVKEPRILEPSHALDFGPGFYTTLNRNQAVDFIRFRKSEVIA